MYVSQATFLVTLANAAIVTVLALAIAFMSCFLFGLTRDQKTSLVGCRLEYRMTEAFSDETDSLMKSMLIPVPAGHVHITGVKDASERLIVAGVHAQKRTALSARRVVNGGSQRSNLA